MVRVSYFRQQTRDHDCNVFKDTDEIFLFIPLTDVSGVVRCRGKKSVCCFFATGARSTNDYRESVTSRMLPDLGRCWFMNKWTAISEIPSTLYRWLARFPNPLATGELFFPKKQNLGDFPSTPSPCASFAKTKSASRRQSGPFIFRTAFYIYAIVSPRNSPYPVLRLPPYLYIILI